MSSNLIWKKKAMTIPIQKGNNLFQDKFDSKNRLISCKTSLLTISGIIAINTINDG